jgi:hypothetical protein
MSGIELLSAAGMNLEIDPLVSAKFSIATRAGPRFQPDRSGLLDCAFLPLKSGAMDRIKFDSDQHYIRLLVERAVGRVAVITRPLFVHN